MDPALIIVSLLALNIRVLPFVLHSIPTAVFPSKSIRLTSVCFKTVKLALDFDLLRYA